MAEVNDVRRSQSSTDRLRKQVDRAIRREQEREANQTRRVGINRRDVKQNAKVEDKQRVDRQQEVRNTNRPSASPVPTNSNRIDIIA